MLNFLNVRQRVLVYMDLLRSRKILSHELVLVLSDNKVLTQTLKLEGGIQSLHINIISQAYL